MNLADIPDRWRTLLDEYVARHSSPPHFDIGSVQFDGNVELRFLDGSTARFLNAFVVRCPDHNEFAVFTEHCLHHIFPLAETEICISDN